MLFARLPVLALCALSALTPVSALTLTTWNVAVTENFDTLGTATGSTLPSGWEFVETGSGANTTYGASNGGSSTGNTYSFGATSAPDRALGSLRTSSVSSMFGTSITNQTGETIVSLDILFTGEQWRLGATSRVDRLDFSFSLDATSLGTGSWLDVDALDFVAPVTSGATGGLDGNASENRLTVSYTLSGITLAPGASLWIRWNDFEATGSDDGLGIDDLSVTTIKGAAPVPDHLPAWASVAVLGGVLLVSHIAQARKRGAFPLRAA